MSKLVCLILVAAFTMLSLSITLSMAIFQHPRVPKLKRECLLLNQGYCEGMSQPIVKMGDELVGISIGEEGFSNTEQMRDDTGPAVYAVFQWVLVILSFLGIMSILMVKRGQNTEEANYESTAEFMVNEEDWQADLLLKDPRAKNKMAKHLHREAVVNKRGGGVEMDKVNHDGKEKRKVIATHKGVTEAEAEPAAAVKEKEVIKKAGSEDIVRRSDEW